MLKVIEEPIIYCIPLILKKKEYKIIFSSKEEKDEYIQKENIYCLKELKDNISAFTKVHRETTKNLVNVKRYAFAISQGYKNNKTNKYALIKKL